MWPRVRKIPIGISRWVVPGDAPGYRACSVRRTITRELERDGEIRRHPGIQHCLLSIAWRHGLPAFSVRYSFTPGRKLADDSVIGYLA